MELATAMRSAHVISRHVPIPCEMYLCETQTDFVPLQFINGEVSLPILRVGP
jgi:hypothetical protein